MRKSIFKREIQDCFSGFNLSEGQKNDVRNLLFENPVSTTKQYLLKKEFNSTIEIEKSLREKIDKDDLIADILTLFSVDDDLELPFGLKEQLARKEQLAIFVGAGVSKLIGMPLWDELAERAIRYLHQIGKISFSEAEKIINESVSPKQKMSIFDNILPKSESKEFFRSCFEFSLNERKSDKNPYDLLADLDCAKFSLNLDHELWNAFERKVGVKTVEEKKERPVHVYSGFSDDMEISSNAVYQIHGSYKYVDKYSIITMKDYLDYYYRNLSGDLSGFLKKVFNKYVVVFIGCGMEEFEILQDLVKSKRHHVLIGAYLNDTNLLRVKKEYFEKTLGIDAHGYYLDFNGYGRLYDVIESWVKQINFEIRSDFYQKIGEHDGVDL